MVTLVGHCVHSTAPAIVPILVCAPTEEIIWWEVFWKEKDARNMIGENSFHGVFVLFIFRISRPNPSPNHFFAFCVAHTVFGLGPVWGEEGTAA